MMPTYMIKWKSGETERIHGESIADAFTKVGYGAGALSAIDEYREEQEQSAVVDKSLQAEIDKYISDPNTRVYIDHNNEVNSDKWVYSVVVADGGGFWLISCDTEKEALQFIKNNSLKLAE